MKLLRRKLKYWIYTKVPGKAGKMPYFSTQLHFPTDSHLFERLCNEGIYEQALLNTILRFLPADGTLLDVGANIGLTALPVLDRFRDCSVFSFEPSPAAFPYLRQTHEQCVYSSRWEISDLALGKDPGEATFHTFGTAGAAFDSLRDRKRTECLNTAKKVKVKVDTLDNWWHSKNEPRVDVIKIDVEGFEKEVLEGGIDLLQSQKPCTIIEWSQDNVEAGSYDDLLPLASSLGFSVFTMPDFHPIPNHSALRVWKTSHENFLLMPNAS